MNEDGWLCLKQREIAGHTIMLVRVIGDDGMEYHKLLADCVTQFRGSLEDCEREWRRWVKSLNAVERHNRIRREYGR